MLDRPKAIELVRHVQRIVQVAKTDRLTHADIQRLCTFWPLASGSFLDAAPYRDEEAVAVLMNHNPQSNPPAENPRIVDALFFAAILLMCLTGGRLSIESTRSNGKLYYYLRYEHPTALSEDMRIRLNRVLIDAPEDRAVAFIGDHHDYRLANLRLRTPIPNMQEPKLGRNAAVKLARKLYEENPPAELSYLSADGYEALLREVLEAATEYHGRREG